VFVKGEYKCLLAAVVGRFEFEQGRKGRRWSGVVFFVYLFNVVCYQGIKEGWREGMRESCSVT